jgi:FkbM family methyltransferase
MMSNIFIEIIRSVIRTTVPKPIKDKIWDIVAREYFDRSAISKMSRYTNKMVDNQSDEIRQMLTLLKEKPFGIPSCEYINQKMSMQFKGLSSQDLLVYIFFNGKKDGFYVDIGANDGITMSNTFFFEQISWKGICVEPQPEVFEKLKKNRRCEMYRAAVSDKSNGFVAFGKASLITADTERVAKRLNQDIKEEIKVKTMTFDELLLTYAWGGGGRYIYFMSLDVEAAELLILESIDFTKYHFGIISVENNAPYKQLTKFKETKGYKMFIDLGFDYLFVPIANFK